MARKIVLWVTAIGVLTLATAGAAQEPPPIGGVTGTVAVEGVVEKEYAAANIIIVKTLDGVEHVFHFVKDLLVPGSDEGAEGLSSLREGTPVVIHYAVSGGQESAEEIDRIDADGLQVTEGTVTRIDRRRKEIAVRFGNGTTGVFRLTDRAAVDAGRDLDAGSLDAAAARVVIYYADENGQKVAHFFKRAQ